MTSVATLSDNINITAMQMVAKSDGNDKSPVRDGKMGAIAKNSALTKNPKQEKE